MRVLRFDIGPLDSPRETSQGFLEVEGYASRTGVFEYRRADGSVQRELRLPEEVFAPDTLTAFRHAIVTDDHPAEGRVDATNAKRLTVGFVPAPASRDGEKVRTRMLVTDGETIKKMRAGKTQLSVGYDVDYDPTPGHHPEYGRYDGVQRKIAPNHIAIVSVGRAGPEARVRMDGAADMVPVPDHALAGSVPGASLTGVNMSATDKTNEKPLLDELVNQAAVAKTRADTAEAKLAEETKRADAAEGRADAAEKRIKQLEEGRIDASEIDKRDALIKGMQLKLDAAVAAKAEAEDPQRIKTLIARRVKILRAATPVLPGRSDSLDALADRDIMLAVIERIQGPVEGNRSDDYIEACFDRAVKSHQVGEQVLQAASARVTAPVAAAEGARMDAATARRKMHEEQDSAWQKPIPGAATLDSIRK